MTAALAAARGGYPLTQLLAARDIGFEVHGALPERVDEVCTDSRALRDAVHGHSEQGTPRAVLFVALRGERFDGHDFIAQAQAAGAAAALIATAQVEPLRAQGVTLPLLAVADVGAAFGALASAHRALMPAKVIAVAGSNGKTTTKELIASILSGVGLTLKTEANHNNLIGLPQTLLRLRPEHQFAVVELGTNQPGELAQLTRWTLPDVAALTCIQPEHLEGFCSLAGVYEEELSLLVLSPPDAIRVVPAHEATVRADERLQDLPIHVAGGVEGATVRLRGVEPLGVEGQRLSLEIDGVTVTAHLPLLGVHNAQNAAVAAAAAAAVGASAAAIVAGLERVEHVKQRMTPLHIAGRLVINDAYNANPGSMQAALRALRALHPGRWVAALGEMRELGAASVSAHKTLGLDAAAAGLTALYLFGEQARAAADSASGRAPHMALRCGDDPADAAAFIATHARRGDAVLLKGSRGVRLERVLALLEGAWLAADAAPSSP
jgi:UDP-N-acetylmuramoyl-tripeptide--D-alanyl-D-alanine ligase